MYRHDHPRIEDAFCRQRTPEGHRRLLHACLHKAVSGSHRLPSVPWVVECDVKPPNLNLDHMDGAVLMDQLKVFEQYSRLISQACHGGDSTMGRFLRAEPGTAPKNLQWLEDLSSPCSGLSEKQLFRVEHNLEMHLILHPKLDRNLALCELYLEDPDSGKDFLSYAMRDAKLYHVEACRLHLQLGEKNLLTPASMASHGALYPLILCAKNMPTLNDWLPVDLHEAAQQWGELLEEINGSASLEEAVRAIETRLKNIDWSGQAGQNLVLTLDKACVAMRVHSGRGCDLDKALQSFPPHTVSPESLWKQLVSQGLLQKCLPPTLLLPNDFKHDTWAVEHLKPEMQGSLLKLTGSPLAWTKRQPRPVREKSASDSLSTLISRLGEVALSPHMAYAMTHPKEAKYSLSTGRSLFAQDALLAFKDPSHVLSLGKSLSHPSEEDVFMFLSALSEKNPRVKTINLKSPHKIIAWRVDPPPRALAFTGKIMGNLNMATFAPHMLKKCILTDEKPVVAHISDVSVVGEEACEKDVTSLVAHYATANLQAEQTKGTLQTTLMEALAVFCSTQPILRTEVPLCASTAWDNDHQDARYAETQTGDNGFRYREWVAVYNDAKQILKCRLDSHAIYASELHTTKMPWCRLDAPTEWVTVVSSAKPEMRVLYERAKHKEGDFASFLCSIKARFLQDLKMLPVRDPAIHKVDRQDVQVYTNSKMQQVLVAYAPTKGQRVEFLLLQK